MPRPYQKTRRADGEGKTRQRIVEATVALHQEKGIAATSMRDVAARADLGLATVYRHFADGEALLAACSGAYLAANPPPDPSGWAAIAEPAQRLTRALDETYAYHRRTAPMMGRVLPELRGRPVGEAQAGFWRQAAAVLAEGLTPEPDAARQTLAAVLLALDFNTWATLTAAGLDDAEAAALAARLVLP